METIYLIVFSLGIIGVSFYYFPFFIVFIVMAFIGLILRIIKNIFEKAIIIKEENELTI